MTEPLAELDLRYLEDVVRRALDRPRATLVDHTRAQIDYPVINPIAGGLYRFRGTARDGGDLVPWSIVLKIAQPPAGGVTPRGVAPPGWGETPDHWNYWRREELLYGSGLLATLPGPLVAPRCYGVDERDGPTAWIWLEEIRDEGDPAWPLPRYAAAGHHLGHLAGTFLSERRLPAEPWLAGGWLRSWIDDAWASLRPLIRTREAWTHLLVRDAFREPAGDRLERLWDQRERFLAALDALPQTFSHRDAYPGNLFSRDRHTVAIDWTQAGPGPIGEDVGQTIFPSLLFMHLDASELPGIEGMVLEGYLAGLRAGGWQGEEREVRLGYALSSALHWAFAGAFALRWAENQALGESMARRWNRPLADIVRQRAAITYYLLDLADEAQTML